MSGQYLNTSDGIIPVKRRARDKFSVENMTELLLDTQWQGLKVGQL